MRWGFKAGIGIGAIGVIALIAVMAQGGGPTWRYIGVGGGSVWPSETGGCEPAELLEFGSDECYYGCEFDAGEYLQVTIPGMPGGYRPNTVLYVRIHQAATVGTGENTWKVQGQALGDTDALSGTWGDAVSVVDTIASVNTMCISTKSTAITIANGLAPYEVLQLRVELDVEASTTTYYMGMQYEFAGS